VKCIQKSISNLVDIPVLYSLMIYVSASMRSIVNQSLIDICPFRTAVLRYGQLRNFFDKAGFLLRIAVSGVAFINIHALFALRHAETAVFQQRLLIAVAFRCAIFAWFTPSNSYFR
jgi:hypothetical protein